eukprot:NODE_26438_length_551_cov_1.332547.p3 GENE.NODE_26438_length_551_cov_1.332547~~NODE_26438_length_551_cov_1.332547.p3  ORF type:complete len:63 (+),score=6.13 NODE_26438_length_551_cov_1.332547:297-485(+)
MAWSDAALASILSLLRRGISVRSFVRALPAGCVLRRFALAAPTAPAGPVPYTHPTLPTNREV